VNAKESVTVKKGRQKWSGPQTYQYIDDDANAPKQSIHHSNMAHCCAQMVI
jgi:hypothetical protein